jgi:hypothetical protein
MQTFNNKGLMLNWPELTEMGLDVGTRVKVGDDEGVIQKRIVKGLNTEYPHLFYEIKFDHGEVETVMDGDVEKINSGGRRRLKKRKTRKARKASRKTRKH